MNSLESFARFSAINTAASSMSSSILTDVEVRARKYTNSLNDSYYEVANEPSLGFYRIQEHVRKSVPNVIEKTKELETFKAKLKGSSFDLDYSLDAIVKMSRADATFESIQSSLTDSLYAARQLHIRNLRSNSEHTGSGISSSQSMSVPKRGNLDKSSPGKTKGGLLASVSHKSSAGASVSLHENLSRVSSSESSMNTVKSDVQYLASDSEAVIPEEAHEDNKSINSI